jgi:hypothetical protein
MEQRADMPLTYEIHRPVLRFVIEGEVEYNDGLTQLKRGLQEARSRGPGTLLWDLIFDVRASKQSPSTDVRRGVAMAMAQHTDMLTGRMAVVVADDRYVDVLRDYSLYTEQLGNEPRLFDKLEDAEAWLKAARATS